MAEELKKVGLEFTASGVSEFKGALKDVNASIGENISAYKLAQSQWDKNTKSSEKLADKQRFLAQQTVDYQKKCELLASELFELENAEVRDEAAISKKKAQLSQAQTQLNKYQKNLDEVNRALDTGAAKLSDYADKLNGTGKKLEDVGSKMTKSVTAPIVGIGTASIAAFNKVDGGLDIIGVKTGATGEAMDSLEESMKKIAKEIPTDFETAGTAIGEVNTRFGLMGEDLEKLSTQFIKFAEINGTDVNGTIDQTQKIMTAYGLTVDDVSGLLDVFNKVGQNTGISMDSLEAAMIKNQAALQEMGLDANSSAQFIGQLEVSGIDSTTALAGLQKALVNAAKEGKPMDEALASLQDSLQNATSKEEGLQLAMELFGNKAGPAIYEACSNGALSFESLAESAESSLGSVDSAYESTRDATDNFALVMNQLMELGYEIASALMPIIQQAIDVLIPIIQGLTDAWNGLSPGMQDFIIKAALAAAATGPIVTGIGKVIGENGIGGLMKNISNLMVENENMGNVIGKVFSGIQSGASSLFSFLAANPVILIIAGIIAAVVLLYNKCEWFRNGVNTVLSNVGSFFQNLGTKISNVFETAKSAIQGGIDKVESFKRNVSEKFENVKSKISGVISTIKGYFNFSWSLPHLKLPHVTISGSFSLVPPRVPKFGISWYAKGGILNRPTLFGQLGDNILGGGEAGQEAVLPIETLKKYIRETNAEQIGEMQLAVKRAFKEALIESSSGIDIRSISSATKQAIKDALREIGPGIWLDNEKIGEIFSRKMKECLFNA